MRELFVYYRVAAPQAVAVLGAVRRLQAGLGERHAGLQTRLLRRDGEPGGSQTWLEIYTWPGSDGGVTQRVQAEIEHAAEALMALLDGPRHCEVFEPL